MQIDNRFIAFWMDTTTAPWTPLTGLSATITIREATAPYTVVVDNEPMTEMWWGHYIYVFTAMSITKEYSYACNPNATAFIESGVTQNTLYKWIEDNRSGWGAWTTINMSGITWTITNLKNDIAKQISELPQVDLNEIKSHIDLAKTDIIDTIEGIEIPEAKIEEKEAKKAVKLLTTFIPKVTDYIDKDMKEKDDTSAIIRELNKLDIEDEMKMKKEKRKEEEEKKMKEQEHKKMLEEQAKMLELEFDKLDQQEQEDKRKELEKELEETLKEAEEIKKELKSL